MDFYELVIVRNKKGDDVLVPKFMVNDSKDLMTRGGRFYAIYDNRLGVWKTNIRDAAHLIDRDMTEFMRANKLNCQNNRMSDFGSKILDEFIRYCSQIGDSYTQLDSKLIFNSDITSRDDYSSKRLDYDMTGSGCPAYDELMSTLYNPEERTKLEWAIGSIISGESKYIQKFIVLYGEAGSGKSTFLRIVRMLFGPYVGTFNAKELGLNSSQFSMEPFSGNYLVMIQDDGDLSKIEDNTRLNQIISHETLLMNEKHKAQYPFRSNAFLFMGTNKPVKITDSKSGIIRRLIDVSPSGRKLSIENYNDLMDTIPYELGGIASHCLGVFRSLGSRYYDSYKPYRMIENTDVFYNFMIDNFDVFASQDGCTVKQAYDMYKTYCEETSLEYKMPRYKFKDELKNYFENYSEITRVNGKQVRSWYSGFLVSKFNRSEKNELLKPSSWLYLSETDSVLDSYCSHCKAQYANDNGTPLTKWEEVTTELKHLDTSRLHYVRLPENHIVIDFDLKDENGNKSQELNLEAASKFPKTYAEFSKSGAGVHLHYIYDGDIGRLSRVYSDGIEIKVFTGRSSLRRKLTYCNSIPVSIISSGLPLKGEKPVINMNHVLTEKGIRRQIERNLRKEIHANTKPSVDMIYKILEDAYNSGVSYDVSDMRPKILSFAMSSTNQAQTCVSIVGKMKFCSEVVGDVEEVNDYSEDRLVFFDVEVFPNLFLINWNMDGTDTCVRMINPTPKEVEGLFGYKLVGFNNLRYDNHILYARYLGYTNHELYELSQRLISGSKNANFREAYGISYTDVYDFASAGNKKSLKKFEIELGLHHMELGLPWDKPVPEEDWEKVAEYCDNDVISTKAVFYYLSGDFAARKILSKLSGLSVNESTNKQSMKIIFGNEKNPQHEFEYRNLGEPAKYIKPEIEEFIRENTSIQIPFSKDSLLPYFPGYEFKNGKSIYKGEVSGEGGRVYANPGMYYNVALLDVASMHPSSVEDECLFGPSYTKRFKEIKDARLYIKHKDYDMLRTILGGQLSEFVDMALAGELSLDDLSNAMKTVINSIYGLTSASFDNPFRDKRNIDNIVAKRGALFMIDLQKEVEARGYTVAHIKTDSIKIPNADEAIINFVKEFGKKYGYEFEHEATYERMCLVNDAVYIAKYDEQGIRNKGGKKANTWTATGPQFSHPYVFKTLFSKEPIIFEDMCETRSVTTAIYCDMNESLPEGEHDYHFIGRVGLFCPIRPGCNGGLLYREKDGKYNSVGGTKGYRWLESEVVKSLNKENDIDINYFRGLVDDAVANISKYGDFEFFTSEEKIAPFTAPDNGEEDLPWLMPCKDPERKSCKFCPNYINDKFHVECSLGYNTEDFFTN